MERPTNRRRKGAESKTFALKVQLKEMLAQPLVAKGVSTRYITSGSRPIVDDLLAGESEFASRDFGRFLLICLVVP